MEHSKIAEEFNAFFEFPTADKSQVSSVSCRLFAGIIADMALAQQSEQCTTCGGAVSVHSPDGEYRGECPFCSEPAQVNQELQQEVNAKENGLLISKVARLEAENEALKARVAELEAKVTKQADIYQKDIVKTCNQINYEKGLVVAERDKLQSQCTALEVAIQNFKEAPPYPADAGWISVDDRLPLEHAGVLISFLDQFQYPQIVDGFYFKLRNGELVWNQNTEFCEAQGGWEGATIEKQNLKVTHWMSLPPAPKGE